MAADFEERMLHLIDAVGAGTLRAEVIVDQIYAKYQELRDDLILHGGGQHHYTRDALFNNADRIMQAFADRLVTEDGSDIKGAVADVAELLATGVFELAPFEFGDLKASGAPHAYDNGAEYYSRPPGVGRLTEEQLREKGHLRRLGFGNHRGQDLADALGATS